MTINPYFVYTLKNTSQEEIYIGFTKSPHDRFKQHRATKDWWGEVDSYDLTVYDSKFEALDAEKRAIQASKPKYNIAHLQPSPAKEYEPTVDFLGIMSIWFQTDLPGVVKLGATGMYGLGDDEIVRSLMAEADKAIHEVNTSKATLAEAAEKHSEKAKWLMKGVST